MTEHTVTAAPRERYSQDDKDFFAFWYGHMTNDVMGPPLCQIPHRHARYIWDAAKAAERERWRSAVMLELDSNGQAHAIVAAAIREGATAREWVGLTDEELFPLVDRAAYANSWLGCHEFARAIEAALRERNT